MELFVPGRICLFGEHTDWAGGYRRINGALERGLAIVVGTNQGIHATVRPHPNKLILRAALPDGSRKGPFEAPMDRDRLREIAEAGGFFSYAAGVAHQVLTHYRVRGLEIDNHRTDLPVQKGLSSSAAICVLVARAFNRLYDLKLTVRGEMEYAYLGEITTPSRCGRLDQGCAFGNRPILMTFDGDRLDVAEIRVGAPLHYVIADLKAFKDTKEILSKLNRCYPFAENEQHRAAQEYLGPISTRITKAAAEAIRAGDRERLGALMNEAQAEFDRHLQPVCPSQLTAPVLHRTLAHPALRPFVLGGKGVGSQGDGTAQFLARDADAQARAIEILRDELGLTGLAMTLEPACRLRKAVIPAAGYGTRLFPATKAVKKELFPVIGRDGRAKPAILAIVEEAMAAGVEEAAIVTQPGDRALFERFFHEPPSIEHWQKLSAADQDYARQLAELGRRVTVIEQDRQEGFGHAVWCAREWVGAEPFLLMLGDHLYVSDLEAACARQLVEEFERAGRSVVGLATAPVDEARHFGCVAGAWEAEGRLAISEFAEKPDRDYARAHLRVEGLGEDRVLTLFGQYALTPRIFELLGENIVCGARERGEFQLTSCLDRLRQEEGFIGVLVRGRRFDIGAPQAFRSALAAFGG